MGGEVKLYSPELDGLRAVAVLLVMAFHAGITPWGGGGVDVFFVLSGFLITSILRGELDRTGRIDFGVFMARRGRRLLPAMALLLATYGILGPLLWPRWAGMRWMDITAAGLFISDWREALLKSEGPLSHTWSLAAEMQFYLVWPLVLVALNPLTRATRAALLCGLWMAVTLLRTILVANGLGDFAYFVGATHSTGLILGGLIANRPATLHPVVGWLALAGILAMSFVPNSGQTIYWRLTVMELLAAAVILAPPAILASRPLVGLGAISYGVYLWHIPVLKAVWALPARAPLIFVLSIGVAWLSYRFVERRFLRSSVRAIALPSLPDPLKCPLSTPRRH